MPLVNYQDSVYVGTIYLGSPVSQPVRVVFDTGSEYLAVTSSLCSEACPTKAYNIAQSDTQQVVSEELMEVSYGSAHLKG